VLWIEPQDKNQSADQSTNHFSTFATLPEGWVQQAAFGPFFLLKNFLLPLTVF